MKKHFSLLLLFLASIGVQAQLAPIMVCNPQGSNCAPFDNLEDAYANANPGDYIYLPGGASFSLQTTIEKEIHVFGAGMCPDSSLATGITTIADTIRINSAGSNSTFEGIKVISPFYATGQVEGIMIRRCHVYAIWCESPGASFSNTSILQSIINGDLSMGYDANVRGNNNWIKNTIVTGSILFINNGHVSNCIIGRHNYPTYQSFGNSVYSIIENSALYYGIGSEQGNEGNTLSHSVAWNVNEMFGDLDGADVIISVATGGTNASAFATFTNAQYNQFNWSSDYTIKETSPGHNGGTDGTDIGPYGGDLPWGTGTGVPKDRFGGLVPSNPHIFYQNIGGITNANGDLPVQIHVRTGTP